MVLRLRPIALFAFALLVSLSAQADQTQILDRLGNQSSSEILVREGDANSARRSHGEWKVNLVGRCEDLTSEVRGDANTSINRKREVLYITVRSPNSVFTFTIYSRDKSGKPKINTYEGKIFGGIGPSPPTFFIRVGTASLSYEQTGLTSLADTAFSVDLEYRTPAFGAPFAFSIRFSDTPFMIKEDSNHLALQNLHLASLGTFRFISRPGFSMGLGPSFSIDYTLSQDNSLGYNPDPYPGLNADMVIELFGQDQLLTRLNYGLIFKNNQFNLSERDLSLELNYQHPHCLGSHACVFGIELSKFQYSETISDQLNTLSFTTTQFKVGIGF
jgi:hypothetical protein